LHLEIHDPDAQRIILGIAVGYAALVARAEKLLRGEDGVGTC
jgi:hypothetical protein